MRKYILHPFFLSVYPILALASINIQQINLQVLIRPAIISLAFCSLMFLILNLVLKNGYKAGLIVSLFLILFYSYGHLYHFLESSAALGWVGHHRVLLPVFLILLVLGILGIIHKLNDSSTLTYILNWVSVMLVCFSMVQVVYSEGRSYLANEKVKKTDEGPALFTAPKGETLPDVYFILLDMHTRSDVLAQKYGYDESAFISSLEDKGFYIAKCSRSNYPETSSSLTATLNMDYVDKIASDFNLSSGDAESSLLKNNLVRTNLQKLGYKTVAFETEYPWSEMDDADYFISPAKSNLALRSINPFESMLIDSTALLAYREYQSRRQIVAMSEMKHPWKEHIELIQFNLKSLAEVPKIQGQKFVFAHILVPHIPFVFAADGTILTDPGYWGGKNAFPVDAVHEKEGYAGQVEFIDTQINSIVQKILSTSSTPPIIVIMGDHGFKEKDRNKIFNAYYFPDHDYSRLYPTISPVNSFRVIANQYFGANFSLLPDRSYNLGKQTFEDSSDCVNP